MACQCPHHDHHHHHESSPGVRGLGICLLGLLVGLASEYSAQPWYPLAYLLALWAGGLTQLLRESWGKSPDIHSLMGWAVIASVLLGHWAEGVFLLLLFAAAEELEDRAQHHSEKALQELIQTRPARVRRVEAEGVREVAVEDVQVGEHIELHGGELVPLDGSVAQGAALVDTSSLTGESVPRLYEVGSHLLSGSKILEGSLRLECQTAVQDSTLARVTDLIQQARADKLRLQSDIERWTGVYSRLLPLSALTLGLWTWLSGHGSVLQSLYQALTLLVVGSPCALVLAAPGAYLSGLVQAARWGILVKGSRHLERLAGVQTVALDKTGTVTTGHFQVVACVPPDGWESPVWLGRVASLEAHTQHPLGLSLVAQARSQEQTLDPVCDFWSHPGRGLQGTIDDRRWWVGRQSYLEEFSLPIPEALQQEAQQAGQRGETVVWAACQKENFPPQVGLFRLADQERPEAHSAIHSLHSLGVTTLLLSGDHQQVVERIGQRLGARQWHGELLPEDKVEKLRHLPETAMVGDGVNDAPALATACVGIAMGASGSQLAIESSDVVLLHSDLSRLADLLSLARRCRRLVLQNLILAGLTILFLAAGVFTGKVGLAPGVLGHEGSTILVVLNGMRALRFQRNPKWNLDGLGVAVSGLCLIHCLALPILLALLPALSWLAPDEHIHQLLTVAAIPVALMALIPGYRLHRSLATLLGGFGGLGMMVGAPVLLPAYADAVSSTGAAILVTAHLCNRYQCRRS